MAKTEVFRVGSLTFLGEVKTESADGKIGQTDRPRIIHEGYGSIDLWGSEDEYRAAAKFFSRLADDVEEAHRALKVSASKNTCGCSCDGQKTSDVGRAW